MAQCRGRSGPLSDVLRAAQAFGLDPRCDTLDGLQHLERALEATLATDRSVAELAVALEIEAFGRAVEQGDPWDAEDRAAVEARSSAAIAHAEAELTAYSGKRGVIAWLLNLVRLPTIRGRARRWTEWRDAELRLIEARAADRRRRLDSLRADPAAEVARRVAPQAAKLDGVRALLRSPAVHGARAEVEVASLLSELPAGYYVLNHLRLRAPHFMRFEGVPLMSAEIDHAVVGPTGVWLVETKCWSAKFVAQNDFHNPFDQADRAGRLCWVVLQNAGVPSKVRQLIVPLGALPARPAGRYAQAVRAGDLRHRIERAAHQMSAEQVQFVANFLWDNFGGSARFGA